MKKLLLLMLTGMSVSAQVHHVNMISPEMVEALRHVESRGRNVTGDYGLARGQWQFHRIAWKDVNLYRARRKMLTYSYDFAWKESVARVYAHNYLHMQRGRFIKSQKREPTTSELWYMWNLGYDKYVVQCKLDLEKLPVADRVRTWKKSLELKNEIKKLMED